MPPPPARAVDPSVGPSGRTTAVALQRRGVELRDRLALLRSRKTLIWGFGTPLGLAFLVPFVAVFLMPGAVAGATLMARDLLGEETTGEDERNRVPAAGHPAPPMFRKPEVGA